MKDVASHIAQLFLVSPDGSIVLPLVAIPYGIATRVREKLLCKKNGKVHGM